MVGPVCESGDFLAKDRPLPPVDRGALLAIFSAGAYGMVMASNYNTRPRAAEILVDQSSVRLVRRRETYEDLVRPEVEIETGVAKNRIFHCRSSFKPGGRNPCTVMKPEFNRHL